MRLSNKFITKLKATIKQWIYDFPSPFTTGNTFAKYEMSRCVIRTRKVKNQDYNLIKVSKSNFVINHMKCKLGGGRAAPPLDDSAN